MITLDVEKRDIKSPLGEMRKSGKIPAVFYGKKEKSTPIALSFPIFEKTLQSAGESTVLHLKGTGIDVDVLIYDVDRDPVTDKPRHVDFYAIEKDKKLEVKIPLEFIGIAPAVKDMGAVLVKVMHELEIEALPKDLPHNLVVDLSTLATFDSVIKVKDIKLPAGVQIKGNAEEIVASVYEPKEEVEAAPVDLSAIEVEKKGKEAKKEGAEGAEATAAEAGKKEAPKKEEKKEEKKK